MDLFILINLLFYISLLSKANCVATCISAKCSLSSPEIRFPFQFEGLHPHQCGLLEFNLFCRENTTMIHFPTYGDLVVKSISYDTTRLSLLDPKNCVHEVFMNLNLSLTPFSYYHVLKEYKYINCSSKLVESFEQVPCLSGPEHHVYIVEPSCLVPSSCSCVKTVAIPFSYSRYLSDSSFGLGLTWNSIGGDDDDDEEEKVSCEHGGPCERGSLEKSFKVAAGIVGLIVFMVGMLFYARYHQELNEKKAKEMEVDNKLLGEYEEL